MKFSWIRTLWLWISLWKTCWERCGAGVYPGWKKHGSRQGAVAAVSG
jgi:hypothetical protein